MDARASAQALHDVADEVDSLTRRVSSGEAISGITPVVAYRAAGQLESLRETLESWYSFYSGYDPLFTWWVRQPYERLDSAMATYQGAVREQLVGIRAGEIEPIIGDPIGAEGLRAHLEHEMIPYTAEELIAIAEQEFQWMEEELLKASREMGVRR